MPRLPYVLLLVLLVSNVYAAEDSSSPAAVNPDSELISGATNGAITNGALSKDVLANDALANGASNLSMVEPLAVSRRSGRSGQSLSRISDNISWLCPYRFGHNLELAERQG